MPFYDHFANRKRNKLGEKIKTLQAEKIFKMAVANRHDNTRILELGPGDGYIAGMASKYRLEYVGIEGSESVARKLKLAGYNVLHAFMPPLPVDIGKFDICFMLHIIEHLSDIKSAEQIIDQVKKSLSCRGKLIIATPDYTKWKIDFINCDYSHNLPFTPRRLNQLLINSGFKIISTDHYTGHVFGKIGFLLYYLVKVLYIHVLDELLINMRKNDIYYRGYLTFLPNIIVVAEKKEKA